MSEFSPYDHYFVMQKIARDDSLTPMEKEALLGAILGGLNTIASMPFMGKLVGGVTKHLGAMVGTGLKNTPEAIKAMMRAPTGAGGTAIGRAGAKMYDSSTFRGQAANALHGVGAGTDKLFTRVNTGLNKALNTGPGFDMHLDKAPNFIKAPMKFLGVNVNAGQRMTTQRAAVWGGGALAGKEMVDTFAPPKPNISQAPSMPGGAPQPFSPGGIQPIKTASVHDQLERMFGVRYDALGEPTVLSKAEILARKAAHADFQRFFEEN